MQVITTPDVILGVTHEELRQIFAAIAVCPPDRRDEFLRIQYDSIEDRITNNRLLDGLYNKLGMILNLPGFPKSHWPGCIGRPVIV